MFRWIAIIFIITLLSLLSLHIFASQQTVPRGVMMAGWDISGLNPSQFRQQFSQYIKTLEGQEIILSAKAPSHLSVESKVETHSFTLRQVGLRTNAQQIMDDINAINQGNFLQKSIKRWQLRKTNIDLSIKIDTTIFEPLIHDSWIELQTTKQVNAQRIITSDDQIQYIPEIPAYRIHMKELQNEIIQLAAPLFDQIQNGQIKEVDSPIHISIPLITIQPEITVKKLKQEGIQTKISEFTTFYRSSDEGRIYNIESTAAIIHKRLLRPGEIFDYSEIIQKTEEKFGFKKAPVILNGKLVPGIGGGICQVSSTLYNAVLRSGLAIVERRNHSLPVKYVPLGQDATFASGFINFKFQNNMDTHIYIHIETTNDHITVKLFGTPLKDITYEIESKTIKTIEPPVKYVKNSQIPRGSFRLLQQGKSGYIVDTFRTTKKNGIVIKKEKISRDHYKASPSLVAGNPLDVQLKSSDDPELEKQNPGNERPEGERPEGERPEGERPEGQNNNLPDDKTPPPKRQIIEDGVSGPEFHS